MKFETSVKCIYGEEEALFYFILFSYLQINLTNPAFRIASYVFCCKYI